VCVCVLLLDWIPRQIAWAPVYYDLPCTKAPSTAEPVYQTVPGRDDNEWTWVLFGPKDFVKIRESPKDSGAGNEQSRREAIITGIRISLLFLCLQ